MHDDLPPSLRYRHAAASHAGLRDLDFSPREMQTLYLMLLGRTRRQIAVQLRVSLHTVDAYRRALCEKVRVRNTTCLIRLAMLDGWIGLSVSAAESVWRRRSLEQGRDRKTLDQSARA